ncbi:hypothetical protein ATO6_17505 [Oceanicola sp. 22II-s10i]|uniref:hypothetical protein n=1 Tax=Oceanicola sp. 22II-s10i TaxID=1317116 RepID=UPI000B70D208|nr:hypothetical protein [Oceanicola sp. 22II-s10i]OWU83657.1 hypothetical protein ATO6_17505 [Oceanicola sp. 22II-s10i]
MKLALGIGLIVALSGCSVLQSGRSLLSGQARATFDGNYYPARLAADKEDGRRFAVTVNRVSQGLNGAKEAARYEASKFCIRNHGWSGIDWTVGPDTPDGSLAIVDNKITFSGECRGWV